VIAVPARVRRFLIVAVASLLLLSAGWLYWDVSQRRAAQRAGTEAVQAARDSIVAILSYRPETAERELEAAAVDRLTGPFLQDYSQLIKTVVAPNAKQRGVSAAARVPAAAVISADGDRVVLLAYVDQTMTVGTEDPTRTDSSVRVTMERVDGRWLVSGFDPV
jgi:Mce-associated membrane protein